MKLFFRKWIQLGRQEMLSEVIQKFEEMHDDYYSQGDLKAADFVVDLVAYLQGDEDGLSDQSV
jgi:hypothetical protein